MKTQKPVLLVIAGSNGSGKTTFFIPTLKKHPWGDMCNFIEPDEIAQMHFGCWNSRGAILKAANKAEEMRQGYLRQAEFRV